MTQYEKNEKQSALKEELLALQRTMRQSDEHAIKCWKLGLNFKSEYPSDYASYTAARNRYNQVELELAALEKIELELLIQNNYAGGAIE